MGALFDKLPVAELAQDASFAYALQARLACGETIFEPLETTYTAYKDQLPQVARVRTCRCNACRNAQWSILRSSARAGPGGRTGTGVVNHYNHGIGNILEKILDWHPFK